jgi:hypothetical protein
MFPLPNGLEIAKHPVGEPPGQLFDTTSNPIRRSWPGRIHRVVRPHASSGGGLVVTRNGDDRPKTDDK